MVLILKLKQVVCFFVIAALLLTGFIFALADEEKDVSLPVIMYHGILKDQNYSGEFVITPEEFEQDLIYLKEQGYNTVFMSQVIDYVYSGAPLPKNPVVITFDDGYYNNYIYAYPLVKEYGMKMVLSVVGKYSEQYSQSGEKNAYYSHVLWEHIKEMSMSGCVEFGNHSYDMHTITSKRNGSKKNKNETEEQYQKILKEDISCAQKLLYEKAGISPQIFTYPFGGVSNASHKVIKELGFKATLGCEKGTNKITKDPKCLYVMKRYIRPHNRPLKDILK